MKIHRLKPFILILLVLASACATNRDDHLAELHQYWQSQSEKQAMKAETVEELCFAVHYSSERGRKIALKKWTVITSNEFAQARGDKFKLLDVYHRAPDLDEVRWPIALEILRLCPTNKVEEK